METQGGCSREPIAKAGLSHCGQAGEQRDRLAADLATAQLQLSPEELARINALDRHHRFVDGSFWELPGGPYNRADIWDEPRA